jgi:hypothetical protein
MTRRPNPENVYLARRAARFRRLVAEQHVDELDAEHLLAAWEREAASRGIDRHAQTFWAEGERWIRERRSRGQPTN